jgi:hypothetical protein
MLEAGQVFYLPPDETEPIGKGDRPHVLVSVRVEADVVTLAYGSTSSNDARFGAEHVFLDPSLPGLRGSGLSRPTFVYPSRLLSYPADELGPPAGRVTAALPELRAGLYRALGIGAAVTRDRNVPGTSRRGRLVELTPELAADWEVRYGTIVTAPPYSRVGYQQTIVPVLDGGCVSGEGDVLLPGGIDALGREYEPALLAVPMVTTLYEPQHIARFLDLVVTPETMERIDRELIGLFGLGG